MPVFLRLSRLVAVLALLSWSNLASAQRLLERDLIEVRLETAPAARVTCTLRAVENIDDGGDDGIGLPEGETKTLRWDPQSGGPLAKTIRVRGGLSWWLSCGSEPFRIDGSEAGNSSQDSNLYHYRIDKESTPKCFGLRTNEAKAAKKMADEEANNKAVDDKKKAEEEAKKKADEEPKKKAEEEASNKTVDDKFKSGCPLSFLDTDLVVANAVSGKHAGSNIRLTASIRELKEIPIAAGNDQTQIVSERSIVSFDQVLRDLGTAAADVAVEKAQENADGFLQDKIVNVFCSRLTVGQLWAGASGDAKLRHWLPYPDEDLIPAFESRRAKLSNPCRGYESQSCDINDDLRAYCERPLLENTCQAVSSIRVAELAASGEALRRAVTSDLATLALNRLKSNEFSHEKEWEGTREAFEVVSPLVESILLSDVDISQQRAQALLFSLASESGNIGLARGDWRDSLAMGVAIVSECLEQGDCTVDQLQRLWGQQRRAQADLLEAFTNDLKESEKKLTQMKEDRDAKVKALRELLEVAQRLEDYKEGSNTGQDELKTLTAELLKMESSQEVRAVLERLEAKAAFSVTTEWTSDSIKDLLEKTQQKLNPQIKKQQELRDAAKTRKKSIENVVERSPQYLVLFSNMRDVLRPPPGTSERETMGRSLNVAFSVLEMALADSSVSLDPTRRRVISEQLGMLRSLSSAVVDERYGDAIQHGGGVLSALIADGCNKKAEKENCKVALTSKQAEKWFGILGAFAAYSTSYNAKSTEDISADELTKYQAEQRKLAMKQLIKAATDRRGRGREWVFSLGTGVQTTLGHRIQRTDDNPAADVAELGHDTGRYAGLSLPMGVAVEWLPPENKNFGLGFHGQVSIVDLGQFVTVVDQDLADPSAATPFYFGLQMGLLVGSPKYNALISADAGYSPGMKYSDFDANDNEIITGGWRMGGAVGMYVPFLDFN